MLITQASVSSYVRKLLRRWGMMTSYGAVVEVSMVDLTGSTLVGLNPNFLLMDWTDQGCLPPTAPICVNTADHARSFSAPGSVVTKCASGVWSGIVVDQHP